MVHTTTVRILQRILGVSLGVFLTFSNSILVGAQGIPVYDNTLNISNIQDVVQNTIGTAQQLLSTGQQFYEWAETFTLASLKKKLVDGFADKIIGYAQGGGGGARFVVNWQDFFTKASVLGVQSANKSIASSNLCSSFRSPLLQMLGAPGSAQGGPANPSLNCDFADGELEAIDRNPANGSWETYRKSLEPQNNIYGAYWIARGEQSRQANEAKEAAQSEAIAGGGFLSPRTKEGVITTPGSVVKDLTSKAAGSDIDLIVNAEQLKDLLGNIGGSLINEITKPDNGGISGVNLARRRAARNNTRNGAGRVISTEEYKPDCSEVVASFATDVNGDGIIDQKEKDWAQGIPFDENGNGFIDSAEQSYADSLSETGLLDLCDEGRTAQTGNQNAFNQTTIAEILTKRREAQKFLTDQITKLKKTQNKLQNYLDLAKSSLVKFDNPNYDESQSGPDYKQYAYAKGVYKRQCFTFTVTVGDQINVLNANNVLVSRPRAVITYIDKATDSAGNPSSDYNPLAPDPVNTFADGKQLRCTYLDGSEIAYYRDVLRPLVEKIEAGNRLAIKKLDALKTEIIQRSKTGPIVGRADAVQSILEEIDCYSNPFNCTRIDPTDPTGTVRRTFGSGIDDDPSLDEPGHLDPSGSWLTVPNYSLLPSYIRNRLSVILQDTYPAAVPPGTTSGNGIADVDDTAREGMTTFYNNDPLDDASNEFYDPAFDATEADLVYEFAKGNFAVIGALQEPEEDTGQGTAPDPSTNEGL